MSKTEQTSDKPQTGNSSLGVVSGSDIPKYTEKQVREAIKMARDPEYWDSGSYWGQLYTEDEIIEELNSGE